MKKTLVIALISASLFGCKKVPTQETSDTTLNPISISITIGELTSNIVRVK